MKREWFKDNCFGQLIEVRSAGYGNYLAFMPNPLPPPINYTEVIVNKVGDARSALRGLDELAQSLPNKELLIVPYLRREAELSSKIEGTQTTLEDLYLFEQELPTVASSNDVKQVRNYISALDLGAKDKRPINLSLIRELHFTLMKEVEGQDENPGVFRNTQNYIAPKKVETFEEATYVPPPPEDIIPLLTDLEAFYREEKTLPSLIEIACCHYQFEAIHPFGDGNGRLGRLLIILMMIEKQLLTYPMLYLSAYFEKHKNEYIARLRAITETGAWEPWIQFFLDAVITQAEDAMAKARRINDLQEQYKSRMIDARLPAQSLKLVPILFASVYINSAEVTEKLAVTSPTANSYLQRCSELGIIEEITGHYHHKVYRAAELLRLLVS